MLLSDPLHRREIPERSERSERHERTPPAVAVAHPLSIHTSASLAEQVRIEPAHLRDWHGICAMVARNFPMETEENLGYWLCHQLPYFRVARLSDEVVGFLHTQPRPDTGTLWVNMLAVDERYRCRGIAHRLVEHIESVSRDWQCQRIGLQCLTSNVAALNLYARHGYAHLGESISERGLQVVSHRKTLSVSDAPRSCPRPPVALDGRPLRMLYRLYYLAWFRSHSPLAH
jgi:ribosomal protein S18 acetylase RimI-like enzyme